MQCNSLKYSLSWLASAVLLCGQALAQPDDVPHDRYQTVNHGLQKDGIKDGIEDDGYQTVLIELEQPSVAALILKAKAETGIEPSLDDQKQHALTVDNEQKKVMAELNRSEDLIYVSTLRVGINGLKYRVPTDRLEHLKNRQGIKSIKPVAIHRLQPISEQTTPSEQLSSALSTSIPETQYLGDDDALYSTQVTKQGVVADQSDTDITIAIIDDGVDYTHRSLGGSGSFEERENNDPSVIEAGTFPTDKVIAGRDIAGADYDVFTNPVANPDPDPFPGSMVNSHGTAVAHVAAGFGIDGVLSPGVAPNATIIAIKVFGDNGGLTALVADGLEAALDPNGDGSTDDRADIINLSNANQFGAPIPGSDFDTLIKMATQLGVMVVAASGNNGNQPYITASPAVYDDVISVGATQSPVEEPSESFHLMASIGDKQTPIAVRYTGTESVSLDNVQPVTGVFKAHEVNPECEPRVDESGHVLFVDARFIDAYCAYDRERINHYWTRINASGVIFYSSQRTGSLASVTIGHGTSVIPSAAIAFDRMPLFQRLLRENEPVELTFDPSNVFVDRSSDHIVATFSSRGPSGGTHALKPEVSAPGTAIQTASALTGDGVRQENGTSFSAPFIAGLAANIKAARPALSPREIKNIIINHSTTIDLAGGEASGFAYSLGHGGVGQVDAEAAITAQAMASPAAISLGHINPTSSEFMTKTITVTNLSDEVKTFFVRHQANQPLPGVKVALSTDSVTLPAFGSTEVVVTLLFKPQHMPMDDNDSSLTEIDGWIIFENDEERLKSGYYAVIDSASDIVALDAGSHLLINRTSAVGMAHAFDLIDTSVFRENSVFNMGLAGFGVRTLPTNPDVWEFALAVDTAFHTADPYRMLVRAYDPESNEYTRLLMVGAPERFFATGTGLSGLHSMGYNALDFQHPIIAPATTDYNDTWIRFLVAKQDLAALTVEGELQLEVYFGDASISFDFVDSPFGQDVGAYTGFNATFNVEEENQITPRDAKLRSLDTVEVMSEEALSSPLLWIFPNNRAEQQSLIMAP